MSKAFSALCIAMASLLITGCSSNNNTASNSASAGGASTAGSVGNNSQDIKINADAQAAISNDPKLKTLNIKVSTSGAQVSLDGSVDSISQKDEAEKDIDNAIQKYNSVNSGVINHLLVGKTDEAGSGK